MRFIVLLSVLLSTGCHASVFRRNLPVGPSLLQHACAAAEARHILSTQYNGELKNGMTLSMEVGGESSISLGINLGAEPKSGTAGGEEVMTAGKSVEVEVEKLPDLRACLARGYVPQIGTNGCFAPYPDANDALQTCRTASAAELRTTLPK